MNCASLCHCLSVCLCVCICAGSSSDWIATPFACLAPSSPSIVVRVARNSAAHLSLRRPVGIPFSLLPSLFFQAECAAGYAPPDPAAQVGGEVWVCSATADAPVGVWMRSDGRAPSLQCSPCPRAFACPGETSRGLAIPCPSAHFSATTGASRCGACPNCCWPCDPASGVCLRNSEPGCFDSLRQTCVTKYATKPRSFGCATCGITAAGPWSLTRAHNNNNNNNKQHCMHRECPCWWLHHPSTLPSNQG